jgi:carnitine monooxygenase subunit
MTTLSTVIHAADSETAEEGKAFLARTMRETQRRVIAHMLNGTTDLGAGNLEFSSTIYTDPARLEREREVLFRKTPLLAGLSADIPKPGDVMLFDAAGPSIIIARGKDNQVRAFLNSCRHRGTSLISEACSHRTRITCPFHGWTYDLNGKLIGLPEAQQFGPVEKSDLGLTPVPVVEWCGLIFVKTDPNAEPIDIDAHVAEFGRFLRHLDFPDAQQLENRRVPIGANWKYPLETFFESYHFPTLHPKTVANDAINHVYIEDSMGGGHEGTYIPNPRALYEQMVKQPESEWPEQPFQGVFLLFPNTVISIDQIDAFPGTTTNNSMRMLGVWSFYPGETPGTSFAYEDLRYCRSGHRRGSKERL